MEMDIIDRIDELRRARGWTVNYLAMEAMITQSTLNNIFSRHSEPKICTLRAICDAFGITLSEFFSEEQEEQQDDAALIGRVRALSKGQKAALLILLGGSK